MTGTRRPHNYDQRIKGILKAAGVEMLITDARVSAVFPDGSAAYYQPVHLDTKR
jgi:hypothetical protein